MALTVAGIRAPLSYCANFRAARIEAAISNTRLRPSSTSTSLAYSPFVRYVRYTRVGGEIHSQIIDAKHDTRRRIEDRKAADGVERRFASVHTLGNPGK